MIFSFNQKEALQLLGYTFYITQDGLSEISILDKYNSNNELVIPTFKEELTEEKKSLETEEYTDEIQDISDDFFEDLKIELSLSDNNKIEKIEQNTKEEVKPNSLQSLEENSLIIENENLSSAEDLGIFANLDLTIITYKNLSFVFPPLVFKNDAYKFYFYDYELTIWENALTKLELTELWEFFKPIFNTDFAAPKNQELNFAFNSDLTIIFGSQKLLNFVNKSATILCYHPALAAINDDYKLEVWNNWTRQSSIIKKYLN